MERITFESFGVKIAVEAEDFEIIERVRHRLAFVFGDLLQFKAIKNEDQKFEIRQAAGSEIILRSVFTDETHPLEIEGFEKNVESLIRNRIAEMASDHVFVHAGVVAVGGQAIVLPGSSFAGKTTLVKALVELGAEYYSDDFAVLDSEARVLPFPKPLSVRDLEGKAVTSEVEACRLKAPIGKVPVQCGLVFITEFGVDSKWEPKALSRAEGMLRIIEHTVPVRTNTEFSLKVLNKLALRAIIAQSYRAEADVVAVKLINYFNRKAIGMSLD
ncbi:MAG TPA: hypothetical protein VMM38_12790 [Aridibacter sp.]|nr:hypothetical protein [Aridibacter sp.]